MALICISLMMNNIEHLFVYLLVFCIYLGKCLFRIFSQFYFNWDICCFAIELHEIFLYFGYVHLLADTWLASIFSNSMSSLCCWFFLLYRSFLF